MCHICETTYFFSERQAVRLSKKINISGVVDKVINQLYNDRKLDKKTRAELTRSFYEPLKEAVNEGFDLKTEYNTPNYEMLKNLQINTGVFAAFKSHASAKDMVAMLKDGDGQLRTKADFITEALKIDNTYRVTNLAAEYDTAVRTARMSAIWAKAQKNKKLFPMLRYVRTRSTVPRPDHEKLVGINRPIDDPFWNTHYPPNGWRCQCSVEPNDDESNDLPDNLPFPDNGFRFNAGKSSQIFDLDASAKAKNISPKELPRLIKEAKVIVNNDLTADMPYDEVYESKRGGKVLVHPKALTDKYYDSNLKTAIELANEKGGPGKIEVLPIIDDIELRKILLPDAKGAKNPDFRIEGKYFDLKSPTGSEPQSRTFRNLLRNAKAQADGIVMIIPDGYCTQQQLLKELGRRYKHEDFAGFEIWLKFENGWNFYTQKSWAKYYKKNITKEPRI